jgi:hypothetical protein
MIPDGDETARRLDELRMICLSLKRKLHPPTGPMQDPVPHNPQAAIVCRNLDLRPRYPPDSQQGFCPGRQPHRVCRDRGSADEENRGFGN